MGTTKSAAGHIYLALSISASIVSFAPTTLAQQTGRTVRHHRVEEQDVGADLLNEAETNLAKQDYAAAEPLLKKYLETYPESYAAWYDLGYLYQAVGKNTDAITAYKRSITAKPDVFESNLNLGLILAQAEDPQAEQYLRAATKLKPTSNSTRGQKRAWMALGQLLENSKSDEAITAFQKAETLDPPDPEPHLTAGTLLEREQKIPEAEQEYRQALSIAPDSPDTLSAIGNFYMREKRFDEAQTILKKLVSVHPNDASGHFQLGRMLAISNKNDEAAAEMEAGLKLDPADSRAQRDLADMYAASGKYDRAAELYSNLLRSNPNDGGLHFAQGRILLKQKKPAEAQQELVRAVQLKPQWGEAYGELAIAADENKDYALAIKATDTRAQYLPENPMSYFLRATAYDHLRDPKQAARYYHQFLEVAGGKYPDQEWQAQHRLIAIEPKK